jgi:hypothetical protein
MHSRYGCCCDSPSVSGATGSFSVIIALPTNVEPDQVACEFGNGPLSVTLPKAEEARPRRIQISGADLLELIGGQTREVGGKS